ncbi:hypothetical protein [Candidatus Enterovibrio escicola]|nr:hypothetical protein [Candidatus Enterovibrio escacola]
MFVLNITVANIDSMEFVVRICVQHSAENRKMLAFPLCLWADIPLLWNI